MKKITKIKEMYIGEEDGSMIPIYVGEDGKIYKWEYVATGNCWMIYASEQKKESLKQLINLINEWQKEHFKSV